MPSRSEGSHVVRFDFEPDSLRAGAWLSAFGALALCALVLAALREGAARA